MGVTDPLDHEPLEERPSGLLHVHEETRRIPRVLGVFTTTVEQSRMPSFEPAWALVAELRRQLG